MTETSGSALRDWRRSRGWDVPELARQLRRAADEPIAAHDGLVRMIRAWGARRSLPVRTIRTAVLQAGLDPGRR